MESDEALAAEVLDEAGRCGLTIVTAESCTAGALAHVLSGAPGASKYLHGGFVTYTKTMKHRVLGVPQKLLSEKTAVAPEVAIAMVEGALERSPADIAVSITGVAGPEPDEDGNPVGLVYCAAVRRQGRREVIRLMYGQVARDEIIGGAIGRALLMVRTFCETERRPRERRA